MERTRIVFFSPKLQGGLTHAALSLGNDRIVEAVDEGVRIHSLKKNVPEFVILRPRGMTAKQRMDAVRFAKKQVGKPYNVKTMVGAGTQLAVPTSAAKLIRRMRKTSPETAKEFQCASLVAGSYTAAGAPIELPTHWSITAPAHLLASSELSVVGRSNRLPKDLPIPWLPMYRKTLKRRVAQIEQAPVVTFADKVASYAAEEGQ